MIFIVELFVHRNSLILFIIRVVFFGIEKFFKKCFKNWKLLLESEVHKLLWRSLTSETSTYFNGWLDKYYRARHPFSKIYACKTECKRIAARVFLITDVVERLISQLYNSQPKPEKFTIRLIY